MKPAPRMSRDPNTPPDGSRRQAAGFDLPLDTPPMEARLMRALPACGRWQYEPKWDGFRCLVFKAGARVELMATGRAPGGPSRWSTERSGEWTPLRPELVVEVGFDHVTNDRLRHGATLLRWRPDKSPRQCTLEQIRTPR